MLAFLRSLIVHTSTVKAIQVITETRLLSTRNFRCRKFVIWILFCALIPALNVQAGSRNDPLCSTLPAPISPFSGAYKKRILMLRRNETLDGVRFTFTSDSPLDNYKSFAESERICIMIPQAALISARSDAGGRGFADLSIEHRDDHVMFSFRLQQGATVAVNQNFNRLDVVFFANEQVNSKETK